MLRAVLDLVLALLAPSAPWYRRNVCFECRGPADFLCASSDPVHGICSACLADETCPCTKGDAIQ